MKASWLPLGTFTGLTQLGHGIKMREGLLDGERIHVLSKAVAVFKRGLQKMASDFDGESVSEHLAGAIVVFHPGGKRKRDPDRMTVGEEFQIDGIGVARGDGNDERLVDAMDFLFRPAIEGLEVLVHAVRIAGLERRAPD